MEGRKESDTFGKGTPVRDVHVFLWMVENGLGVTETTTYENWCWNDHLSDENTYKEISCLEALTLQANTRLNLEIEITLASKYMKKHEQKFFKAVLAKKDYKMARFYALKKTKKSRGIIDNNDTFLQESSRWAGI